MNNDQNNQFNNNLGMNNMPNQGMSPQPMNNMPNQVINPQMNMMPGQAPKKKLNPLFIAIPVVVVIIAIIVFVALGGENYKEPIEYYCQGMNDLNYETLKKALPDEIIKEEGDTFESTISYLKTMVDSYGMSYQVTCEIGDKEALSSDDLKDLNDEWKDEFNTNREISKAYYVDVTRKQEISYSGESDNDTEDVKVVVAKIDGKWYYVYEE